MSPRAEAAAKLEARLGYVFADRELFERALTHASARGPRRKDNERLEFLGDRVLGLIIASALVGADAEAEVGELTRRLHGLANGEACARVAQSIGLGEALRLPSGETRRGARELSSILGDACEALIAALYLEVGLERTAEIVLDLWAPLMAAPHDPDEIDPKTQLQEWAAAHGRPAPAYRVLERTGPAHAPMFTLEVVVAGEAPQTAVAGQVRAAEKGAALALLKRLKGAA
jgi:ribonuclease III